MAYSTSQELSDYATARGVTLTGTPSVLLTLANDYLETFSYKGSRTVSTQGGAWPRTGVIVDGVSIDSATVPSGIKKAELQLAIEIDKGFNPMATIERAVKREKVDVLEVEYADSASDSAIIKSVDLLLAPYLATDSGVSFGLYSIGAR